MMNKTTKYTCTNTLLFSNMSHKGESAFTKGNTYEGQDDCLWREGGSVLIDNEGNKHTISASMFGTMFKECK